MQAQRAFWCLAAVLLLSCSSAVATGKIPTCKTDNPCPKTGTYYHCLCGKAINGCQAATPFPIADCSKQCITKPPPVTVPNCPSDNPCPKTGTYYHCLCGKAVNGCQLATPFPTADCSKQCISKPPPVAVVPNCPSDNPCPKSGAYYHCLCGKAKNGCQAAAPFPSADCSKQCISKPPSIASCPTAVPCPMDGTTYYTCQKGKACSGCRKLSDGPFPSADCSQQCTYNSADPQYIPPACPAGVANTCPTDGQAYYWCQKTGECRPQQLGWIPLCSLPGEQCLLPPSTANSCTMATPCPKDSGAYWYCQAGKAKNGCQAVSQGPFPAADCTLQCKTEEY